MAQTAHRSTSRVLDIIELLSASIEGHTLTEIAQLLNSPKSSILPMLQTMAARGFIDLNYRTNRYTIGLGLYFAASIYRNKISVNKFINLEMQQVTYQIGESCCLGVMDGKDVLFLHRTNPPENITCDKTPGQRELGCIGAMGKALLCDYKLDELTEIFFKDGGRLPPETNLYRAHIQMEEVRPTGISYEYGEVEPNIQCVAAPIRVDDRVVAALGIILPTFRMNLEKAAHATKALQISTRKIENVLSVSDENLDEIFSQNGFKNL